MANLQKRPKRKLLPKVKQNVDTGGLDKKQRKIAKLLKRNDRFGCFLGPGSGKTRISVQHMLRVLKANKKVNALIVTTKANVIDTWPKQLGQQMKHTGIKMPFLVEHKEYKQIVQPGYNCRYSARIVICTYENLRRLGWHYNHKYFDFLLVDESVHVKNPKAKATERLATFAHQCRYVYPLSGLPAPNKIQDLYTQVYLLDFGKRLGTTITAFRNEYMQRGRSKYAWDVKGYPFKKAMLRTQNEVLDKINDICVTEDTESFIKVLTKARYHTVEFDLKPKELKRYKKFERSKVLEINAKDYTASTAAVLQNKLLQYTSGNLYEDIEIDELTELPKKQTGPRKYDRTTSQRMKAFDKLLSKIYWKSDKLIVSYGFKHSIPDIVKVLERHVKRNKIFIVDGSQSTADLTKLWNANKVDVIVSFAGSISEGLNLQEHGGSVVFYTLTYNYNHFYQLIRRIKRRGNPFKWCDVYILSARKTHDSDVSANIRGKEELGKDVMSAATLVKILARKLKFKKAA